MSPEVLKVLQVLEASALAEWLRQSPWALEAAAMGHAFGFALIIGAVLPLDLRLMGFWRTVPFNPLARVLIPVSATGVVIMFVTGGLLFSVEPVGYANMPLYRAKLVLIALALANSIVLRAARDWPPALGSNYLGTTPRLRWAGIISALAWLGAFLAGMRL